MRPALLLAIVFALLALSLSAPTKPKKLKNKVKITNADDIEKDNNGKAALKKEINDAKGGKVYICIRTCTRGTFGSLYV